MDNLKGIDNYNVKYLKKEAKVMGIPTSYKNDNNRWLPYSKSDLYDKIKEKLHQK